MPADLELARRDPALPGLALLLDTNAFAAAACAALPEVTVGAAEATYVRYKPTTSCLVAYRLEINGVVIDVYAKAHRADQRDKLNKARERIARSPGRGFVLDDVAIAAFFFPIDRKLDTLACLTDEPARHRLFRHLLSDRPYLWEASLYCLHYKPERRYVAAMLIEGIEQALLRLYTTQEYRAVSSGAHFFVSRGPLRIAKRLGQSDRRHALVLEWLPGRPLDEVIIAPSFDVASVRLVGEALAVLHSQTPEGLSRTTSRGLSRRSRKAEISSLFATAMAVATVCPHLDRFSHDLALRLATDLSETPFVPRAIHGDFSADQVLLTGERVAILDLDNVAWGDPVADLGTFVAQLARNALRGELTVDRIETITSALLAGYTKATNRIPKGRLDLYVAAGLLRLAPHAFRNRESDWPFATEAILEQAVAYYRRSRAQ